MLNTGRFLGANLLAESWCENQAFSVQAPSDTLDWAATFSVQAPSDTLDWAAMLCLTLSYFGDWLGARAWRGKKRCEYLCLGGPIMLNTVLVCGLGGGEGPGRGGRSAGGIVRDVVACCWELPTLGVGGAGVVLGARGGGGGRKP